MSRARALGLLLLAGIAAVLVIGTAFGHSKAKADVQTWTTVFKSPISIEGLTLDDQGNLYIPQRNSGTGCAIVRVAAGGGPNQAGVVVAKMNPPCGPAGIAFGPDGRLYLSGFGPANPATRSAL